MRQQFKRPLQAEMATLPGWQMSGCQGPSSIAGGGRGEPALAWDYSSQAQACCPCSCFTITWVAARADHAASWGHPTGGSGGSTPVRRPGSVG